MFSVVISASVGVVVGALLMWLHVRQRTTNRKIMSDRADMVAMLVCVSVSMELYQYNPRAGVASYVGVLLGGVLVRATARLTSGDGGDKSSRG